MSILRLIFSNRFLNICYTLVLLGLSLILAYVLIGSEVDEQGILREAFILLPIGGFLVFIGGLGIFYKFCLTIFSKIFPKK